MIRFRPMRAENAAVVAGLIRTAFARQAVPVDPPASALEVTAEVVLAHLAGGGGGAIAEAGGRVVGSVLWETRADGLYVSRLAVDPEARRRGIGQALMGLAEQAARGAGAARLSLGTRLALSGNRRLFAACGYIEVAEHAHPGYAEPTWVEMERRLG
ncbi:MAG TPA: GNAT family N-acetyltransferase [Acetobacteraceae bacterium]